MTARKKKNPVQVSKEVLDAAEKIIQKAFACKTNEDFRDTVALDNVFKDAYGKSALEMAGICLVHGFDNTIQEIPDSDGCLEHHVFVRHRYEWHYNLLPSLPKDEHHFWYVGSDPDDDGNIISDDITLE